MTVTLVCQVCDRPHVQPVALQSDRCPFCGGGCRRTPRNLRCEACGEAMAKPDPDGICGFCRAEHEANAA